MATNTPENRSNRMADEAYRKRAALRERGLAGQEDLVTGAREGLQRFDASAEDRQRQIRFGAARGLAAAAPTGRMAAGGGFLGAAGQAGLDSEMAGIRQAQADEQTRFGLRQGAAQAEISAAEYAAQAGNKEEDYVAALADAESAIEGAISENRGWINDDEEAMNSAVRSEIAKLRLQNPEAARELERKYLKAGGEGYQQIND